MVRSGALSRRVREKQKQKTPHLTVRGSSYLMPGSSLLTWGDPTLPSALRRFTSEFGMGSGGTTALKPPGKFCYLYQAENLSLRQNTFGVVRLSLTVH